MNNLVKNKATKIANKTVACFLCFVCCSCVKRNVATNNVEYLDYAASADINPQALQEFINISKKNGNSSGINSHAKFLKSIEHTSSNIIAKKINANPENIIFTSNATMSNNLAILGVAHNYKTCHLITSKIEHKGVLNIFKHLEATGYQVTYIDVDENGKIDFNQLKNSIRPNTKLVSVQMLNSEIGSIQDIDGIGRLAKSKGILFHCDASQSFCKYLIDVKKSNIDLLTISGYKIGAPKGIAALYAADGIKLRNIIFGSEQNELMPGTKPTALIAAFATAVDTYQFDHNKIAENFIALRDELKKIDGIFINSNIPSHVLSFSIQGVLLKDILEKAKQYSFSAGCSCLGQDISNVLQAIDPEKKLPSCTLRISFSDKVPSSSLVKFAERLKKIIYTLREEKQIDNGCQSVSESNDKALSKHLDDLGSML